MKRGIAMGVIAAAAAATFCGMTGSAFAAGPGGAEACPNGTVCLYYNSPQNGWGSSEHWSPGGSFNLSQYTFSNWGNGSGYGQTVAYHAASIVNNTGHGVTVCAADGWCYGIGNSYGGVLPGSSWNGDTWLYS